MKPTALRLRQLLWAGACLAGAGCGGSDVPDPSSDAMAANEPTSAAAPQPRPAAEAAPEPTPAPAPAEVAATPAPAQAPGSATAPVETAQARPSGGSPETTPAPAAAESTPAATPPADAATAKADTSGTDEMMRIAGAGAPAQASPAGAEGTAPPAAGSTPPPAVSAVGGGRPPEAEGGAAMPPKGPATAPGGQARRIGEESSLAASMGGRPGGAAMSEAAGGPGSRFGASGGPSGAGADPGPDAFRNPGTAVQAFLSALRAKNKDRLSQATARRAATEAAERNRKVFAAILEQSVSDEELDDMVKSLEGYQVISILQAKSTGQVGVLIGRSDSNSQQQRTVQVRREKEGWKVMDFGGTIEQKQFSIRRFGRR